MPLSKPDRLEKGDVIGVIAPSSGFSAFVPHRLQNAVEYLKKEGYRVKLFPTATSSKGHSSDTPLKRANDINDAFGDDEVKAIICNIGGYTANQTLKFIDFDMIKENPKIFSGYSDISVLHYAFYAKSDLTTFYGPCTMTQFAEYPKPLSYTIDYFNKAVCSTELIGKIKPSDKWTDEIMDWFQKSDLKRSRKLIKNEGYEWLREGNAQGKIIGGCLPSIMHLKGTEYWPEHKGGIMFIDIPEGHDFTKGEPVAEVESLLTDLDLYGTLSSIKGLIIGRPTHYGKEELETLKKILVEITEPYKIPILYGADIGHTDPILTLPLGVKVKIDSHSDSFEVLESGVS